MVRRWLIRGIAIGSILLPVAVVLANAARGWPTGGLPVLYATVVIVFAGVGWLIMERRPGNAVGPLVLLFAALFALYLPADLYLQEPGGPAGAPLAAVFASALDAPMFILLALTLIVFPDGQAPSPRWRPVFALGALGIVLTSIGSLIESGPTTLYPAYVSPFGIAGLSGAALVGAGYMIMLVLLVLGAVALTGRWRRGDPTERAQIKWVVAAALLVLVVEVVNVATFHADDPTTIVAIVGSLGLTLIPIAIGVAILRYHLYDIDRIISRTIGYLVVSVVLASVFVGAILVFSALLSPVFGENPVVVAASTLIVAALFRPLRRRVQSRVDRRFNRSRYDAERTVAEFSARLRDDVDLESLGADVQAVVAQTLAPVSMILWTRPTSSDS